MSDLNLKVVRPQPLKMLFSYMYLLCALTQPLPVVDVKMKISFWTE